MHAPTRHGTVRRGVEPSYTTTLVSHQDNSGNEVQRPLMAPL